MHPQISMKWLPILTFVLALSAAINPLFAQQMKWKVVAPNALTPPSFFPGIPTEFGAIAAKGKIVVAGWKNIIFSTNNGSTWVNLTIAAMKKNDIVMDIAIYDDMNFAVMTANSGAFLTSDQGLSWQLIINKGSGLSIVFDGSPNDLTMICGNNNTVFDISPNRNFTNSLSISYIGSLRIASDGTLRILGAADGNNSLLYSSFDHGSSWFSTSALSVGDNYSFIADGSDPNRFVAVDESYWFKYGTSGNSKIFLTTDNGNSWKNVYDSSVNNYRDLCGNSATACHDYFVGTTVNGVLRSSDKGLTWQFIGGPPMAIDSRSLAAENDSLVYAIDVSGSIWATDAGSIGNSATISGNEIFAKLILPPCDTSVTVPLRFSRPECAENSITTLKIVGKDSSEYSIIGTLSKPLVYPDSIHIRFTPSGSGKTDAHLKILYSNGTSLAVDLSVNVSLTPLSLSNGTLFKNDTIFLCSHDSTSLKLSALCTLNISSLTITGIDSASFNLAGKKSALLPKDSNVKIYCNPQHIGNLTANLHLIASDGRSWDVPINLLVKSTLLQFQPSSLFSTDTIASCASDSSVLSIRSPCAFDISSLSITGTDAASFIIAGKTTASLPADSLVKVICIPTHSGKLSADLHIVGSDGRLWDIVLSPFIGATPLQFLPRVPFRNDTIIWCLSDSTIVSLSASCPLDLSSITISGSDAASFLLSGKNSASLPNDSVIKILCNPQHVGKLNALLHIISSDGRTWDIPLNLFASEPALQFQPASLFVKDSLEFCSANIDSVLLNTLCNLDLVSISITGVDASSFVLSGKQTANLPADSIITVRCIPQHPGSLSASLHLITAGGAARDIPISPFVKAKPTIAFDQKSITNAFTDIIGGDVTIPIVFLHSGSSGNAKFTIHYDSKSLIYHGVFDASNSDHTSNHPDTNSARISINTIADTILYSRFSFFPIDSACTHITIDSIIAENLNLDCLNILTNSAEAEICSPSACGRTTLGRFLRFGTMPQFSITPNPSSGSYTITISEPLGFVMISITDKLGIVRATQTSELSPTKSAKLNLESLPSGLYFVRVSGLNSVLPIVLEK